MSLKIGGPGPGGGGGSGFAVPEHEDHLLALFGVELREGVQTRHGVTDAAHIDTIVCMDDMEKFEDNLIFGQALVPMLTNSEADVVVCRIVKGEAQGGKNAPWLAEDGLDIDQKRVEEFAETYATQLRSGTIVVEMPQDDKKF